VTLYRGEDDNSSRYTKHVDNGNKNGRRVTAIYYLNDGWKRAHGGALRLYTRARGGGTGTGTGMSEEAGGGGQDEDGDGDGGGDGDDESVYCDVEPVADRLVVFLSDQRTPHEVPHTMCHVPRATRFAAKRPLVWARILTPLSAPCLFFLFRYCPPTETGWLLRCGSSMRWRRGLPTRPPMPPLLLLLLLLLLYKHERDC